ncbi:MAG: signal peptidase I [Candidatus Kaiserbacteria bacterium]|nr:MAG: signal peptidase I [Candidatus Kaiserbacteria bacterium]
MNEPVMQNSSSQVTQKSSQTSLIVYTIIAIGLALFIRFFIAAPYVVSGASMEPNFHDWNYLIIDRLTYDLSDPARGDVIVFALPGSNGRSLIKRVIGLPGETVRIADRSVRIVNAEHPDGFVLDEPYLDESNIGGMNDMSVSLGDDQYFVLGDNRKVSADSRSWGTLPRADIVGRVLVRLFPLNGIGILPGQSRYDE